MAGYVHFQATDALLGEIGPLEDSAGALVRASDALFLVVDAIVKASDALLRGLDADLQRRNALKRSADALFCPAGARF